MTAVRVIRVSHMTAGVFGPWPNDPICARPMTQSLQFNRAWPGTFGPGPGGQPESPSKSRAAVSITAPASRAPRRAIQVSGVGLRRGHRTRIGR